jgi:hypothetical protein
MITVLFEHAAKTRVDNAFAHIGGSAHKHEGFEFFHGVFMLLTLYSKYFWLIHASFWERVSWTQPYFVGVKKFE